MVSLPDYELLSVPKKGRLPKNSPEYREAYEDATAAGKLEELRAS